MNRKEFIRDAVMTIAAIASPVTLASDSDDNVLKQCRDQAKKIILAQLHQNPKYINKQGKEYCAIYPVGFFHYTGKSGIDYKLIYDLPVDARRIVKEDFCAAAIEKMQVLVTDIFENLVHKHVPYAEIA